MGRAHAAPPLAKLVRWHKPSTRSMTGEAFYDARRSAPENLTNHITYQRDPHSTAKRRQGDRFINGGRAQLPQPAHDNSGE
ncbi:hypothetical protein JR316_0009267 [Psilocybe cubensis]|uniref:Uncharacterized protein n=1 Tax=Psilocybe cubensis TaxID=181762 RepID=A0ACB8GT19_PSICU|nr:hypothetical protein JR316_0009267 [Psilocybe cubensis]KAH9478806.1 hypothetical protein JR316_0009267 [Psilocybe cubensis]